MPPDKKFNQRHRSMYKVKLKKWNFDQISKEQTLCRYLGPTTHRKDRPKINIPLKAVFIYITYNIAMAITNLVEILCINEFLFDQGHVC